MRILSIATLFPNPVKPGFGIFVGNQMRSVVAENQVDLTMVSPIGIPPWPLSLKAPYGQLKAIAPVAEHMGILTHYPKFRTLPLIGGSTNPERIVRTILPLVRKLHMQTPFDLVDAQFFFPDGPAAARIAKELGIPCTIKARGADIHFWSQNPKALDQVLSAAEQASGLLTVSEALRQDMIALGISEDKISVHYTGLDHATFHPRDRQKAKTNIAQRFNLDLPLDATILVTPGALIPRKGQELVLQTLQKLPDGHLLLAGSGPDAQKLTSLAKQLRIENRVHFLGQVDHTWLSQALSAAQIMVLPSASEGLANVWVESLASGTPIIIPDIGGARDVVQTADAGRIADRSPAAILAAIQSILESPPKQADTAKLVSHFSWQRNAQTLIQFWKAQLNRVN